MIPLVHDLSGERVLVFGGGPVGARKARRFAAEASVIVVSPSFVDESFGTADRIRAAPDAETVAAWIDRFEPALIVAATDDDRINEAVTVAAQNRGILVNRTDRSGDRPAGSVVVPATVEEGPVTVAISTDGTSPALSQALRRRLEEDLEGIDRLARVTGELREALAAANFPADERRAALRSVVESDRVWTTLRSRPDNLPDEAMRVAAETLGRSPEALAASLDGGDAPESDPELP